MNKSIDNAVFDGIRKTINRFRERPFHYFTEADIHTSLAVDILSGSSDILTKRQDIKPDPPGNLEVEKDEVENIISISLVHQEYPTNFRYKKEELLIGYSEENLHLTNIDSGYGDRGNYDLAVINPDFLTTMFKSGNYINAIKNIINKNIGLALQRDSSLLKQELLYAIEVKFIHEFNASSKNMIDEVKRDNEKLRLAYHHSDGFVKPINLVFCASGKNNTPVIPDIRKNIVNSVPDGILNIFVESFLDNSKKITPKPTLNSNAPGWSVDLVNMLLNPKSKIQNP